MSVTPEELRALAGAPRGVAPTKYRSRRTYVAELDRWFASIHEAEVAITLWRRQQAGEIRGLCFQTRFQLAVAARSYVGLTAPVTPVCTYVADFQYLERQGVEWVPVVADAKSPPTRTAVYRLKKKLMAAILGITIVEL